MIGNNAVRELGIALSLNTRQFYGLSNEVLEEVYIVIIVLTLKNCRCPFKSHACIDRRLGQRFLRTVCAAFILHENEVPDFDKAITIFIGRTRRAARNIFAVIKKDFRTWATWSRITHGPEIIRCSDADDTVIGKSCHFFPKLKGFVISVINRNKELIFGKAEIFGDQIPCMLNGIGFKIIAKTEITEHFEKCVVTGRIADIVQIIMLTARAYAFL